MVTEQVEPKYCNPATCNFCRLEDDEYLCSFQRSLSNPHDLVVTHLGAKCIYSDFQKSVPKQASGLAWHLAAKLALDRMSNLPVGDYFGL